MTIQTIKSIIDRGATMQELLSIKPWDLDKLIDVDKELYFMVKEVIHNHKLNRYCAKMLAK